MESIKGKVALITGASSGIGAATAVLFAKYGSKLVLTGRNEENLNKTAETCISQGLNKDQVFIVTGDVSKDEDLFRIVDSAVSTFGTINILVNNAASSFPASLLDTSMENFDEAYRVILRSVVCLTKLVVPHLKKNKGTIVNISTIIATVPFPGIACCSVMKAAVSMVTKDLALELAPHGVRVNEICPGSIRTPQLLQSVGGIGLDEVLESYPFDYQSDPDLTQEARSKYTEEYLEQNISFLKKICAGLGSYNPTGRVGFPEEIAQAVVFLASDASTFTTGESLKIDGGLLNTASWNPLIKA